MYCGQYFFRVTCFCSREYSLSHGGNSDRQHHVQYFLWYTLIFGMEDDSFFVFLMAFVDCRFCLSWSKWPLTVASLFGKCLCTIFLVNYGKDTKKSASMVSSSVDLVGGPSAV